MDAQDEDPPPEAGKLPTGRVARTARVGGLVTGQGLRWAGMRTANRVRTPERAAAAAERAHRGARQPARRAARADARRGDEGRSDDLDGRVRRPPRGGARRAAGEARGAPRRRPAGAVREAREADARGVRRAARARVLRVRRARVRGGLDRPGPPRHDRRRRRRRRQGPVPRGRGGGRDRSAQRDAAAAAGQAARARAWTRRRSPRSCASGSARSSTTSSRRRTSAASSGCCAAIRSSACPRVDTEPLDPARARVRVHRGRAVRGGAPARRGAARPLRRDRLPVLLRPAVSRPDRARRPSPRQLPAVPRRPGRLP